MANTPKPAPDFPLFRHATGQWAKKKGGKLHYFGTDPQAALERYNAWQEGQKPPILAHAKESGKSRKGKPSKPYPDFPLYAHASGQWAKRILGRVHYFGTDPQAALEKYLAQKDALLAGRAPALSVDGLTVKELANRFLNAQLFKVQSGDLNQRTFDDYKAVADMVVGFFGPARLVGDLAPDDFTRFRAKLAETRGPVCLGNQINRVRILFKFAYDNRLIDRPVFFGSEFRKPKRAVLLRARQEKGPRMFTHEELRSMLGNATKPLKAMILLGINCGFGNHDCAVLPVSALDLDRGWVDFPRPKTAVSRRCRLWPETTEALREMLAGRNREPVFLTKQGHTWERKGTHDPVCKETAKLLKALGIHRKGLNFYALRHTFQTIGEESGDAIAVKYIMGHTPEANDMSAVYRERMTDKRLHAVAAYVRRWLFKKRRSRSSPPGASASGASASPAGPSPAAS